MLFDLYIVKVNNASPVYNVGESVSRQETNNARVILSNDKVTTFIRKSIEQLVVTYPFFTPIP